MVKHLLSDGAFGPVDSGEDGIKREVVPRAVVDRCAVAARGCPIAVVFGNGGEIPVAYPGLGPGELDLLEQYSSAAPVQGTEDSGDTGQTGTNPDGDRQGDVAV